ncbi:MAG: ankyrin repeat domain-containing protein [Salinivirgaceae bacterium]|nr:ankyrin repeat domain-containing protein [Salinivirgaceae bacterium]
MKYIILIIALWITLPVLGLPQNSDDVNKLNKDGLTPLMVAVMQQDINKTKRLITAGADVNSKTKNSGEMALHYAACGIGYSPDGRKYGARTDGGIITAGRMVEILLQAGADVNAKTNDGSTALIYGVENNTSEITAMLINANADVHSIGKNGMSALLNATYSGFEANARLVLNKGADVSVIGNGKLSVLLEAARHNFSPEFIKDIIEKGADVNAKDRFGQSVLYLYTLHTKGTAETVQYLISKGADVNEQVNRGKRELLISNTFSSTIVNQPVLDVLLKAKPDLNLKNYKGQNIFGTLAKKQLTDTAVLCRLISQLIAAGADVNIVDKDGMTPLMHFVKSNNFQLSPLLTLIDAGADLHVRDKYKNTALDYTITELNPTTSEEENPYDVVLGLVQKMDSVSFIGGLSPFTWAASKGYVEIVRLCIEKGVDVNSINGDRYSDFTTPLIYASVGGHVEVVKLLIQANANVNKASSAHHYTPLIFAAHHGNLEVVKLLIASKANINAKTKNGDMAVSFAINEGHEEIAKLLIHYVKTDAKLLNLCLLDAVVESSPTLVKWLIDANANVNTKRSDGYTPLIIAVIGLNTEIVKMLIDAKVDVNFTTPDGASALDQAKENGNKEIIEILKNAGAK